MDTQKSVKSNSKKVIIAPEPTDSSIIPSIYSITIAANEEIEWKWLEFPDGNRVVINYNIICPETINLK